MNDIVRFLYQGWGHWYTGGQPTDPHGDVRHQPGVAGCRENVRLPGPEEAGGEPALLHAAQVGRKLKIGNRIF